MKLLSYKAMGGRLSGALSTQSIPELCTIKSTHHKVYYFVRIFPRIGQQAPLSYDTISSALARAHAAKNSKQLYLVCNVSKPIHTHRVNENYFDACGCFFFILFSEMRSIEAQHYAILHSTNIYSQYRAKYFLKK